MSLPEPVTDLVELLERRAQSTSGLPILTVATDAAAIHTMSAAELWSRARAIAARLQSIAADGARVLVPSPTTLDSIVAFWGALCAGAIPVPLPPLRSRHNDRLARVIDACRPAAILGTGTDRRAAASPQLPGQLEFVDVCEVGDEESAAWRRPSLDSSSIAFLQYTSGSTGMPKGVIVSHGNLLTNAARMATVFELSPGTRCVSWLPLYHDMGLIGGMLQTVYSGYSTVFLTPAAFVERPLRWLETISAQRATVSGGPNFGYELVARALESGEPAAAIDLRWWSVAFSGSEPIRADTLRRFARAAEPYGFRASAVRPCYGLAEATLLVSAGRWREDDRDRSGPSAASRTSTPPRVSLGAPLAGLDVLIVDPRTRVPVDDGETGEVWISGDGVAGGYWQEPDATRKIFAARVQGSADGRWLRTGDIGCIRDGELVILDRLKDLIIVRGANYYAHDLEAAIETAHPALRTHGCAAVGVVRDNEERVVVLAEVDRRAAAGHVDRICSAVQQLIARRFQLIADDVVLLRPGTLPRTSSGKVRRRACRDAYLAGALTIVGRAAPPREIPVDADGAGESDAAPVDRVRAGIVCLVADAIGVRPADVPLDEELGSLGADSLRLMQVRIAIRSLTGVELSYSDLLGATVDRLAALGAGSAPPAAVEPPRPTEVAEAPLTAGQQALRFLTLLHPEANAYSIVRAMRIRGRLDFAAFAAAVSAAERRHQALRTTVAIVGGEPVQRFTGRVRCEETDASGWDEARLASETAALVRMPYDLAEGPLVTVDVFRLSPSDRVLVFRAHHIAADLWSLAVLLEDLEREYGRAKRNEAPVPAPAMPQYSEHAAGQRTFVDSPAGERLLRGWLDRLQDYAEPLPLPIAAPRTAPASTGGGKRSFSIDARTAAALRAIARAQGATLNAVITAAFEILLWRYSGQDRFLIGMLASGRTRADLRTVIGYCVNLVAVRARLRASLPFESLLRETRDEVSAALDGQEVPFSTIVQRLHPERPLDRTPLVRVTCVYQPTAVVAGRDLGRFVLNQAGGALAFDDLKLESLEIEECAAQFDLSLVVTDAADGRLIGALHYDAALFDAAAVEELANGLRAVLTSVAEDPRRPIGAIPLIDADAYRARAARRNRTARSIDDFACVHELIAGQAKSAPDAAALAHGASAWSYRDLSRCVEACAARLRTLGIGPEARVAVCIERSPEMVAALVGAMSAGAAYVPLDPTHPRDRIDAILRDASPAAVIASRRTIDRVASAAAPLLLVDELGDATDAPIAGPAVAIHGDNAAYVMYTSGSTGAPKGVVVTHRNLINLFHGMDEKVGCGPTDTLVAVTSVAFDISIVELLWTLARGARVVIADEIQTSPVRRTRRRQRGLDVSLFYFAATDSDGSTQKYDLLIEGAKLADRNGFAAVWTPERHFHPFGGLYPNPSVTSAALAALTHRVRIRAGSVVLPLHHPARVAEEWSVVDNLSRGRVGVAFASGWHAQDFALAPEVYAARRQVMVDRIQTVRRLWRGEGVSVPSVDGREHTIALFPKPVQKELPVWLTAAGSPETFAAAAALSANVLTHLLGQDFEALRDKIAVYTRGLADRGLDRRAFTVTLMLHAYVDETPDKTIARALPPFKEYLRSSLDLVARLIHTLELDLDLERMSPADLEDLIAFAAERYMRSSGLFGTPAACLETLDRIAEYGADEVACLVDFGVAPDAALASIERIAALVARFNRECERGGEESFETRAALGGATMIQCTPSMAALLFDGDGAGQRLGSVRALMLGGEPVPAALVRRLGVAERCLNMYGPTETTVWSAVQPVQSDDDRVTVGGPIANTQLHVLDGDGNPLPDGVAGEVWIGGAGVSRGYWRAPAKTAERFVPDPYSHTPGARAYRTGDVGRQLSDGRIELLGRTDHQVKIRGSRVELGDVEAAVAGAPGVARAAVVKQHDSRRGDELVAYVVPHHADRLDLDAVRGRVRAKLPANMVPTIVTVNALPLTPNGKVDRVRLAREPAAIERPRASTAAASPRTDSERLVRDVWRAVLGHEVASIDDNFFDVGGHSLLIAQVHERLQKTVGWSFPLVTLLEHPTIRGIAAFLEQRRPSAPSDTAQRAADQRRALLAHRRFAPAGAPGTTG